MKHKLLSLFVAFVCATHLWAYDAYIDGIYYYLNSTDLTATVTNETGYDANSYSGVVVIPSTITYNSQTYSVTTIGSSAFCACSGLTSVTIPNSVTTIGDNAFYACGDLTSIIIPYSVTTIGEGAFRACSGLTSVTIPNSVKTIGKSAFYYCVGLTSVTIGNSVTTIGDNAFYYCTGLTSVTIPNSVTTIGEYAFSDCYGLTSVTIPNSVTTIGEGAFFGCIGLTSPVYNANYFVYMPSSYKGAYTIPNGIKQIVDGAFYGCYGLTTVTIPNSVTTIGEDAFWGCYGLISVTIPNSVTTIGKLAFLGVLNIMYNGTAIGSPWGAKCMNGYVDGYLVYADDTKTTLIGCSIAAIEAIIIPNTVTTIGSSAFEYCSGLISVTIPNSVTMIGNNAFGYCSSIEEVYVYVSNPYPFETEDPVVIVNPIITKAFTATTPQYILQNVAHISTDNTPTCVFVHVDLSKMETSQYAKLALDFAGTKYELSTKESTVVLTGLNPASTNQATFYSQLIGDYQWREGATIEISTGDLALTTLTPKVVSAGTAIVAAETNISDYETNVGFEWRKYNAPPELPSSRAQAILYNGQMEGILHNLSLEYWRVRAYYEAADGTCYYGEWATFDPSQPAYFEPTVHTYALVTDPTANKVQIRGYVMTGTDDVTEQGFEYWFNGSKAPRRVASATPDSVYRVQASGQVMTAVLEDLAYSTTYTCRAYAVAGGKTYYGEEVQFLTPEDPRPIYTLSVIAGENGSVNTDVSGQYREGETVTLTATAEQGFRFVQWSDGNTDNPRQLTITANTVLVAFFELADGLEWLTVDDAQCTIRKMIIDNQLFIFRGGKIYNAAGGLMK